MGDRCWVEITVRAKDVREWLKLGYDFEFDEDEAAFNAIESDQLATADPVDLKDSERNYGVSYDGPPDSQSVIRGDLVAGCPMIGRSGPGGCYGAAVFAWDGEVFYSREATHEAGVFVGVDERTGEIDAVDAEKVKRFVQLYNAVETSLAVATV